MERYAIANFNADYIDERIKKSKQEIIKSILVSLVTPVLFLALKTSFFEKEINQLMIVVCISMAILGVLTMVRISIIRLGIFKKIVKEIIFESDGNVTLYTVSEMYEGLKIKDFEIHKGYDSSSKWKNILDLEYTYRIQNRQTGLQIYLISSYFEKWEDLKDSFSN